MFHIENIFNNPQVALICIFLDLDLDMLVAMRTCPTQSWTNPGERCMAFINIALQHVSTARVEMQQLFEELVSKCTSMKDLRKLAKC